MKNTNGVKVLVIAALVIGVLGLSLGFAAFSNTLQISSSATVSTPSTNFNVSLSRSNSSVTTGSVTPTVTGATGSAATLTATKITGLKATFTNTAQSVKYSFYAYNAGQFVAYLNSVVIGGKTCTAVTGTTQSYVDAACNGISITVKVGSDTYTSSNTDINSHSLAASGTRAEVVEVTIAYANGSALADGDFNVEFGDVVLTYGSAD